jgi:hypothetical protein
MKAKYIALAIIVIAAVAIAVFYFTFISPIFVSKPAMPKPELGATIEAENVNWLSNELGAYMLHPDLSDNPPVFQIRLSDTDQIFTVSVINNVPSTETGQTAEPDIRMTMDSPTFRELYEATDFNAKVNELYNEGSVTVELLKDTTTLAIKGYKGVYDMLGS